MASVLFKFGNQAAFDALASGAGYDSNSLYFIEDTARLYKGSVLMGEQAIFTTSVPQFGSAKENRIYVVTSSDGVSLYVKSATEMVQVGGGTVKAGAITSIEAFDESVITKAAGLVEGVMPDSDTTIPTASAVKGAIDALGEKVTTLEQFKDSLAGKFLTDSVVDNFVGFVDANGNIKDSGKKAGGATLAAAPDVSTLATEAAVFAAMSWQEI